MTDIFNISASIDDILNSVPLLLPEFTIGIGFLVVILLDLFIKKSQKIVYSASILTILITAFFLSQQLCLVNKTMVLFNGMFVLNKHIIIFKILTLFASLLSILFFYQDERLKNHNKGINDFFTIFLASILSLLVLISSNNLLMAFIAIEMLSLGSYLMVNYTSDRNEQVEGGLKYFMFGAAASAVMLYGITFIYGFSGSLDLGSNAIALGLNDVPEVAKTLVMLLFMVGIGFKLSFAPLHFWTPDVYQSTPTSVTSFISTVPKIAVFSWLLTINPLLHSVGDIYLQIIFAASVLTMILGNVVAIFQKNLKRLMAYSSIGHTGVILALFAIPNVSINALFFYLTVYVLTNIGAFLVFYYLENRYNATTLADLNGLGKKVAFLGALLVVFIVSLIGLPPTGGFIAKFFIFTELVNQVSLGNHIYILLIVAVLTTVISLFFYFNLPLNFFLKKSDEEKLEKNKGNKVVLYLTIILGFSVLIAGIFPSLFKIF